jgi:hypothetical protein
MRCSGCCPGVCAPRLMTARNKLLRAGLVALAILQTVVGGWALGLPRGFYQYFPLPGHRWVTMLPPYNGHLVRDYGGLCLGFALLFVIGALSLERRLVAAILASYEFFTVPHFIFHVSHLEHFPFVDAIAQTASLGLAAAVPLVLLAVLRTADARSQNGGCRLSDGPTPPGALKSPRRLGEPVENTKSIRTIGEHARASKNH